MKVRRLKRVVAKRGVVDALEKMMMGANKIMKELPRLQAYDHAYGAVSRNVEIHKKEHFMRLIDVGLNEKDPEKGSKLIETVKDIAEAYKINRNSVLREEIIEHVKHVGKAKNPEMLMALGEVAEHIRRINHANLNEKHAEIILRALAYARTSPNTLGDPGEREYAKRMSILKEHLKKYREGEKEEAVRRMQEIMGERGRQV